MKKNYKIIVACVIIIIILIMLIAVTAASNPNSDEEQVTVSTKGEDEQSVEEKGRAQQHAQELRENDEGQWDVKHWIEDEEDEDRDHMDWIDVNPFQMLRDADMDEVLRFMWPSRQRNFLFDRTRQLKKRPYPKRATLFDRIRHARDDVIDKMGKYIDKITGGTKTRENHSHRHSHRFARADLRQVNDAYELIVDVPGMDKKDIQVRIREDFDPWSRSMVDVLEVEGRRKHEMQRTDGGHELQWEQRRQITDSNSKPTKATAETAETAVESEQDGRRPRHRYLYTERSIGQFQRKFLLPKRVLKDKVHATLKDGILTVRMPIDPKEHQATPSITNVDIE